MPHQIVVNRNLAKGSRWTREEMILCLNLYLKLPYGQLDHRTPAIIELANLMGRSANTVSIRLNNYSSCDPQIQDSGRTGMEGGRKQCQPYWDEFDGNREALLFESEKILAAYQGTTVEQKYEEEIRDIPLTMKGETRKAEVKIRVNQSVFRQVVLANYGGKCALTGIDISDLLVASHIIPWADNVHERLNPQNGICLSNMYDKAFDRGLISFLNDGTVIFSQRLKSNVGKEYYDKYFLPIESAKLTIPRKYHPNELFLEWHRDTIFNKK